MTEGTRLARMVPVHKQGQDLDDVDPRVAERMQRRIDEIRQLLADTKKDRDAKETRKALSDELASLESALAAARREKAKAEKTRRIFAGLDSDFHRVVARRFPEILAELENEALTMFDEHMAKSAEARRAKQARIDGYLSKLPSVDRRSVGLRIRDLCEMSRSAEPDKKAEIQRERQALENWLAAHPERGADR